MSERSVFGTALHCLGACDPSPAGPGPQSWTDDAAEIGFADAESDAVEDAEVEKDATNEPADTVENDPDSSPDLEATCGNGTMEGSDQCDDGNANE